MLNNRSIRTICRNSLMLLMIGSLAGSGLAILLFLAVQGRIQHMAAPLLALVFMGGVMLLPWGLMRYPVNRKAARILSEKFPQVTKRSDLTRLADLIVDGIQAMVVQDHLIFFSKHTIRVADLQDVQWLFLTCESSRGDTRDLLVITTRDKKRQRWVIPNSYEFMADHIEGSERIKPHILLLLNHIRTHYPNIELGYSKERETLFLADRSWLRRFGERLYGYQDSHWVTWLPWEEKTRKR